MWGSVKIGTWWQPGADHRFLQRCRCRNLIPALQSLCEGHASSGKGDFSHLADFQAAASALDRFMSFFVMVYPTNGHYPICQHRPKGHSASPGTGPTRHITKRLGPSTASDHDIPPIRCRLPQNARPPLLSPPDLGLGWFRWSGGQSSPWVMPARRRRSAPAGPDHAVTLRSRGPRSLHNGHRSFGGGRPADTPLPVKRNAGSNPVRHHPDRDRDTRSAAGKEGAPHSCHPRGSCCARSSWRVCRSG